VIAPGLIATPMSQRAQQNDHIGARLTQLQPLTGDFGSAEDVAAAAAYCCRVMPNLSLGRCWPLMADGLPIESRKFEGESWKCYSP
jgi:hypothetical protein